VAVAAYRRKTFNNDRLYDNYIEEEGRHNGGLIYFGSSYKHCQHDLADH
jgi:hypothetical protein